MIGPGSKLAGMPDSLARLPFQFQESGVQLMDVRR